jgi:hypothetical protein
MHTIILFSYFGLYGFIKQYVLQTFIRRRSNKTCSLNDLPFGQELFWDVSISNLNGTKHKKFNSECVITYGLLSDFYWILKIYAANEIVEILKQSIR